MNFNAYHSRHNQLDGMELIENILNLSTLVPFFIEAGKWPVPVWDVKLR